MNFMEVSSIEAYKMYSICIKNGYRYFQNKIVFCKIGRHAGIFNMFSSTKSKILYSSLFYKINLKRKYFKFSLAQTSINCEKH